MPDTVERTRTESSLSGLDMTAIRPATDADLEGISVLTTELARKFIVQDCTSDGAKLLLEGFHVGNVRERFEAGFRHFVAVDEGRIVGVVVTRHERHLLHLFVAESHQRRGIARALWDIARQACLDAGNPGEFTVNSSRRARSVYEAFGFVALPESCIHGVTCTPMTVTIGV